MGILKEMFNNKEQDDKLHFEKLPSRFSTYIKRKDLIKPGENAVEQSGFRGSPMNKISLLQKVFMIPMGLKMINQVSKSLKISTKKPKRDIIHNSELKELELFLKELNVLSYGYTKVDRDNIFLDRGIVYGNAIVISIEMPKDKVAQAPSFETMQMVEETYAETGDVVHKITDFIREKGFGAQAGPGLGGMTIYPVMAKDANMGKIGRHGLMMTPENGPSQRLAVVYTNIKNFPEKEHNKHEWIADYCSKCGLCIKKCPSKAIYDKPIINNNKHISHINYDKCMSYFNDNFGCTVCVKVCPFTKVGYDKLHEGYLKIKSKKEILK